MTSVTVKEIAEITGGKLLCGDPSIIIDNVQYDSRNVKEGSLFVPIVGEKVDAHKFIPQCLENGAASFSQYDDTFDGTKPIIKVDNTISALQKLASWQRSQFPDLHFIGVTGSVGKTSTKEMIAAALSGGFDVMKTPGNKNSQIGMPCTMFDIEAKNQAAVIEMGMSEFGEMDRLCDVAHPNIAVMTNIGKAHIENLKTQENILSEKFKITKHFTDDDVLFINGDDPLLKTLYGKQHFRTISFGFGKDCDYYAENISTKGFSTEFDCIYSNKTVHFSIPALGEHSVKNALAAIAIGRTLGLSDEQIQSGLLTYKNAPMRQQIYQLSKITIIDDSYNASPEATKVSLDVLKSISKGKSIAVLADMLELGEQAASEHYGVGKHLAELGIDILFTVGTLSENTAEGAAENGCGNVHIFKTNEDAYNSLHQALESGLINENCTILVKGSRGMHTDEIVKKLLDEYK